MLNVCVPDRLFIGAKRSTVKQLVKYRGIFELDSCVIITLINSGKLKFYGDSHQIKNVITCICGFPKWVMLLID